VSTRHRTFHDERRVFAMSDQPHDDVRDVVTIVLVDVGDGRTETQFSQQGAMPRGAYEPAGRGRGRSST
jgi:hypothetical protein